MPRRRKIILISVSIALVLISIIYFSVRSIATPFLTEEQLKRELAESSRREKTEITSITDIIAIDDKHKVVLFVMGKEQYGKSFWRWDRLEGKWQQVHFSIYETPELWMIDEDDESSYRLIWHQSPETEVKSYNFYLLKQRGYHVSNRNGKVVRDVYEPQIQLEHLTALDGQSYGVMSLPEVWIKLIKLQKKATTNTNSRTVSTLFNTMSSFVIHFKGLDHNNNEIPEADLSKGSSFARGGGSRIQVLTYPTEYFMDY